MTRGDALILSICFVLVALGIRLMRHEQPNPLLRPSTVHALTWSADSTQIYALQRGGYTYFLTYSDSTGFAPVGDVDALQRVCEPRGNNRMIIEKIRGMK